MKRIVIAATAAVLALSLTACSGTSTDSSGSNDEYNDAIQASLVKYVADAYGQSIGDDGKIVYEDENGNTTGIISSVSANIKNSDENKHQADGFCYVCDSNGSVHTIAFSGSFGNDGSISELQFSQLLTDEDIINALNK